MPNRLTRGKGLFGAINVPAGGFSLAGTALAFTAAQFNQVMAAFGTVTFDRGVKIARVALGTTATAGGVFAWQNPEASSILIHRVLIDVTTVATGACTIDVGTTAVSAATSSDTLIDGLDVNAGIGLFDNITEKGSNGKSRQKLASGKWVTASQASGAIAGIVGYGYVVYSVI
jgi:hypothetical protein